MSEEMQKDVVDAEKCAESMDDYKEELEASFKRVHEGDVLTGTVVNVSDDQVMVDLKYYAPGIILKEDLSNDPAFVLLEEIHVGDELTATVVKTDDGEGNIMLSRKEANDNTAWAKFETMMADRTVVSVKITEIVNGGAIAFLDGIRGFIPASKLAGEYVEDLGEFNGKTIDVTVITVDREKKRLVMSGREVAREKMAVEKNKKISKCEVGVMMEGTVDSIMPYGAFVNLNNGLSGLLHISQISSQRIKHPSAVLKEGQTVTVKIIAIKDNKISLSMKELAAEEEVFNDGFEYKETGSVSTGLGDLLKGFKL